MPCRGLRHLVLKQLERKVTLCKANATFIQSANENDSEYNSDDNNNMVQNMMDTSMAALLEHVHSCWYLLPRQFYPYS